MPSSAVQGHAPGHVDTIDVDPKTKEGPTRRSQVPVLHDDADLEDYKDMAIVFPTSKFSFHESRDPNVSEKQPFNPLRDMSTTRHAMWALFVLAWALVTIWGWVELTSVHQHLIDVLCVALFFFAMWLSGALFTAIKGSALVGFMISGIVLGPEVLNLVPHPHAFELFGSVGVMMLLGEAGLHMDVAQVIKSGKTAAWLTLLGMGVPWFGGMGVMMALGFDTFASLAGGACFAPTSVGMATKILQDFNQLESVSGQMMITIAMVDDVLSLIVLAILVKLGESAGGTAAAAHLLSNSSAPSLPTGGALAWIIIQPILFSACFMIIGLALILGTPSCHRAFVKRFKQISNSCPQLESIKSTSDISASDATTLIGYLSWENGHNKDGSVAYVMPDQEQFTPDALANLGSILNAARDPKDAVTWNDKDTHALRVQLCDSLRALCLDAQTSRSIKRKPMVFTIWFMLCFGLLFGFACGLLSTELLGVFMAGVAFSNIEESHHIWKKYLRPLTLWLARLFFAAKIGFAVPVGTMLSWESFLFGLALSIPSVWGKVLTGLLVPAMDRIMKATCYKNSDWPVTTWGEGWKIGWGRVGRGEFAFYMAQISFVSGIMDERSYACVVWALLISSFQFPFAFRLTMNIFTPKEKQPTAESAQVSI